MVCIWIVYNQHVTYCTEKLRHILTHDSSRYLIEVEVVSRYHDRQPQVG